MLTPNALDHLTVDRHFEHLEAEADPTDGPVEFVAREAERRLLPRLEPIRLSPVRWIVDVGCGRGVVHLALLDRFPEARIVGIDRVATRIARPLHAVDCPEANVGERCSDGGEGFEGTRSGVPQPSAHVTLQSRLARVAGGLFSGLRRAVTMSSPEVNVDLKTRAQESARPPAADRSGRCGVLGDAHVLPLADGCADMVWCSTAAHWFADPVAAIREWRRVLRPGGLVVFSALGPDSFGEVRDRAGADWPVFQDMHDWGDALLDVGFAAPVMESERLELTYEDRDASCTPRMRRLASDLGACVPWDPATDVDNVERLTLEFVFGHAWVPEPAPGRSGEATIHFVRNAKFGVVQDGVRRGDGSDNDDQAGDRGNERSGNDDQAGDRGDERSGSPSG